MERTGTLSKSVRGHTCFIPGKLPPRVNLPTSVFRKCEEVAHLLGQVRMGRRLLPNAEVLTYGSLGREALASSTIEDTVASPDELLLFETQGRADREDVKEVGNYAAALRRGQEVLETRPITEALILELHSVLMSGVRGHQAAGRFKTDQNYIARSKADPIEKAIFVPPPPERTPELVADLSRYITNPTNDEPSLVQVAICHYQFETIHPFGDGNGRVGRLLIILQLMQLDMLPEPLIYPSVYFERTREDYYGRLQAVRDKGEWVSWIEYFLEALATQAREAVTMAELLLKIRERIRADMRDLRRAVSVEVVLDAFFKQPALTVRDVQQIAGVAYNTAAKGVEVLREAGVLRRLGTQEYKASYVCGPLFDLLFYGPSAVEKFLSE